MASATPLILTDRFAGEYASIEEEKKSIYLVDALSEAWGYIASIDKSLGAQLNRNLQPHFAGLSDEASAVLEKIVLALEKKFTPKLNKVQEKCFTLLDEGGEIESLEHLVGFLQLANSYQDVLLLEGAVQNGEAFVRGEKSGGDKGCVVTLIESLYKYPFLLRNAKCLEMLAGLRKRLDLSVSYPLQQSTRGIESVETLFDRKVMLPFTYVAITASDDMLARVIYAPYVVQLYLESGDVSAAGFAHLPRLPVLVQLICPSGMRLTDEIVDHLMRCKSLRVLYLLDGTRITRTQYARLATKLGTLIIREPIVEDGRARASTVTTLRASSPAPRARSSTVTVRRSES